MQNRRWAKEKKSSRLAAKMKYRNYGHWEKGQTNENKEDILIAWNGFLLAHKIIWDKNVGQNSNFRLHVASLNK